MRTEGAILLPKYLFYVTPPNLLFDFILYLVLIINVSL